MCTRFLFARSGPQRRLTDEKVRFLVWLVHKIHNLPGFRLLSGSCGRRCFTMCCPLCVVYSCAHQAGLERQVEGLIAERVCDWLRSSLLGHSSCGLYRAVAAVKNCLNIGGVECSKRARDGS